MTDDTQRLLVSLEARIDKYEKDMARAKTVTSSNFQQMESRAKQSAAKIEQSFAGTGAGIRNALSGIGAVFASVVSANAAKDMIDSSIKIQNQLKTTGLAGKDLKTVYDQLFVSAQKNATPLEALVTLYSRTSGAAKDLGANQQDLLKFTDGVSLAMRVSGQSAGESAGALLQLSQALGDGKIQAEEYNSLLDAGRPILAAVASGLSDAGGSISTLTQLVKNGKVSSEAFFRAFLAGMPTLQAQVASSETTISASFVRLQNVLIDAAGRFNSSAEASKQFGAIIDQVAVEVQSVNFDTLIKQIGAVTAAVNQSIATLDSWASKIGTISGLGSVGKGLMSLIPGDTVKIGGAYSQDAVQDRIDGAFGVPSSNTGLSAAQVQSQIIDGIVKSPAITSALSASQIQAFARKNGSPASQAAPTGARLPAATPVVKPVSLADYPVPAAAKASKGGGSGGGSRDGFANDLKELQGRTTALQAATAAQAALNPLVADYGEAVATAKARQDLLNAAQKQNKTVTPEMSAQIDAAAQAYGRATAAAKQLSDQQQSVKETAEAALGTARDVTKGLITDLASGKSGAEALSSALQKVGDAILDNILNKAFSMQNMGGLFNGFFGGGQASLAASGSISGLFADGGWTGPGSKYQPAGVVHADEYVFSKKATRALGVGNLDSLHTAAQRHGFAEGGYTGSAPAIRKPSLRAANANMAPSPAVTINAPVTVNANGGSPTQNADLAKQVSKEMEQSFRGLVTSELRLQMRPGNMLNSGRR